MKTILIVVVVIIAIGGGYFYISNQSEEIFSLGLPVKEEDVVYGYVGIWPYGVVNDLKPKGHSGIDFDTAVGAPVFAAEGGVVSNVSGSTQEDFKTITIRHNDNFSTFYTGTISDISISKGDSIKKGQQIGKLSLFKEGAAYGAEVHFHFELHDRVKRVEVCPYDFMGDKEKKVLERIHEKSVYNEKSIFSKICN